MDFLKRSSHSLIFGPRMTETDDRGELGVFECSYCGSSAPQCHVNAIMEETGKLDFAQSILSGYNGAVPLMFAKAVRVTERGCA